MKVIQIENKNSGGLEEFTLRDLVAALKDAKLPPDTLVVCSSDAEGNSYHPLMQVGFGIHYRPGTRENYWSSELIDPDDPDQEGVVKGDRPCLVLVPMD